MWWRGRGVLDVGLCPLVLQKLVLCVPFLHGRGAPDPRICSKGDMKQMLVRGQNLNGPVPGHRTRNKDSYQRESNMHQIEGHHFVSPFAPNLRVGGNSGFMLEIL